MLFNCTYYLRKFKPTTTGVIITLAAGGVMVVLISEILVPGLPGIAGSFELFFVNNLGMFFGSGALVFLLIIGGLLVAGIRYSHLRNMPILNTFLLATAFILIGYGSYAGTLKLPAREAGHRIARTISHSTRITHSNCVRHRSRSCCNRWACLRNR